MNRFADPFRYLAGGRALSLGLLFMLATALLLHAASMIQDRLVHFTFVRGVAFRQVLAVEVALWLLPAVLLYGAGRLLSRSRIRPIDVLGTTAFAQLPLLPMNLPFLFPQAEEVLVGRVRTAALGGTLPATNDLAILLLFAFFALALLVLFYWWNYRAFAVSCNVRGPKAVSAFAAVQLIGMAVSPYAVAGIV